MKCSRHALRFMPAVFVCACSGGNNATNVAVSADANLTTITIQGIWSDAWPRLAVEIDTLLPPESSDVELAHVGEVAASANGRVVVFDHVLRRVWSRGEMGGTGGSRRRKRTGPRGRAGVA